MTGSLPYRDMLQGPLRTLLKIHTILEVASFGLKSGSEQFVILIPKGVCDLSIEGLLKVTLHEKEQL